MFMFHVLFLQMKSTTDVTQDTLTDCLTIHPLQPSLSPLAGIDNNLNPSPGASYESYSGMSVVWLFALICFIYNEINK